MLTLFIDFIPVLLFLIAFKIYGIYVATTVGIVATAIQVVLTRIFRHRYDKQQLITLAVFSVFGGMTLYFHNPIFVKWKPSIVFWIFSSILIVTHFFNKPLIQRMLEGVLEGQAHSVPAQVWKRLNMAWAIFFLLLGGINLYIAYTFSTEVWVNFKVYGILGLLIVFSVFQSICLARYMTDSK